MLIFIAKARSYDLICNYSTRSSAKLLLKVPRVCSELKLPFCPICSLVME